jgi:hypothetical protein
MLRSTSVGDLVDPRLDLRPHLPESIVVAGALDQPEPSWPRECREDTLGVHSTRLVVVLTVHQKHRDVDAGGRLDRAHIGDTEVSLPFSQRECLAELAGARYERRPVVRDGLQVRAGNHRRNDDAGVALQRGRYVIKRGRRRRDEDNISGKKLSIVGHPHAQLTAEGSCRRIARMRSAD